MINFQYFPRSQPTPDALLKITKVFKRHADLINSETHQLQSDDVLKVIEQDLEKLDYVVKKGQKAKPNVSIPVLYGLNNIPLQSFKADAVHRQNHIVLKVEAGRALANNEFLKDIFDASMMSGVEYLVLAVRNIYQVKDFEKIYTYLDTLYTSGRITLPLKGILLIGY